MHCDESVSGVQEGSNDKSSESDPFLAPTYESEDSADDIEVNQQENVEGGIASGSPQVEQEIRSSNPSSPVDNIFTSLHAKCDMQDMREGTPLRLLHVIQGWCYAEAKNPLKVTENNTEALPTSVDMEGALERGEGNVLVKKRSKTIEQAAPISVDEAAGCHPQTPPPVVTTVESTRDCRMDDGTVKKKPDMDKQREIQAIKVGLPNKICLRRRPGHASLDVTPELLQPDYNVTVEYQKYQRKYLQKKKTLKETNAWPAQLGVTLPLVSDRGTSLWDPVNRLPDRGGSDTVWQDVKEQAPLKVTRSKRQLLQGMRARLLSLGIKLVFR
ncbi:hypothetical protein IFM89_039043 [Coptis chinensis]|uniref:Uncharacterized protein n=1 Tax=Coptis chinensis TaxID=261450 RepID=A0A835J064_9MAGN|nr:hypothetical protein IFM89_039043 [Coptis chinensis]